jgi:hypothetical protein
VAKTECLYRLPRRLEHELLAAIDIGCRSSQCVDLLSQGKALSAASRQNHIS